MFVTTLRRAPLAARLLPLAALVSCTANADREAEADGAKGQSGIVSTSSPTAIKDYPSTGIPPIVGRGRASAPYDVLSADEAHDLFYTDGRDLPQPPLWVDLAKDWVPYARGGANADYESSPKMGDYLLQALAAADSDLATYSAPTKAIAARLNDIVGVTATEIPRTNQYLGYTPVQARWTKAKYADLTGSGYYKRYDYPDPKVTNEIRERGARLYCAARRAAAEQAKNPSSTMLGEQVALPLKIFGKKIDIGVLQAMLAIGGPERYTGAPMGSPQPNDGAQAFKVPMFAGARIIPIRGIAKALEQVPEVRTPIVLVSGDSEVVAAKPQTSIPTGYFTWCLPTCRRLTIFKTDYPQIDQTVTHADAVATAFAGVDADTSFPLFSNGWLSVDLLLKTKMTFGEQINGTEDRLWQGMSWPWPGSSRPAWTSASPFSGWLFDDSAWKPTSSFKSDFALDYPVVGQSSALGTLYSQEATQGLAMRALQDDDHHVVTANKVSLTATIVGKGEASIGPVVATLQASGSLTGAFQLEHHLRDGLYALNPAGATGMIGYPSYPLTGLTVTPKTSTSLSFNINANLHLFMELPFGATLDLDAPLLNKTIGKTYDGKPWDENRRLRVGTGSNLGDVMKQPWAPSHLPGDSLVSYNSFDTGVDACLADVTPNPPVPPACPPSDGPVSTPRANYCIIGVPACVPSTWGGGCTTTGGFGTASQWVGACTNPAATAASMAGSSSGATYECYRTALEYLCSPTSRTLDSGVGISHLLELGTSDPRLGNVITKCVAAAPAGSAPDAVVKSLFNFSFCDDTARPISASDAISTPGDGTTEEPVSSVPACR